MPFPIGIFSSEEKAEEAVQYLTDTYHGGRPPNRMTIHHMEIDVNYEIEREEGYRA